MAVRRALRRAAAGRCGIGGRAFGAWRAVASVERWERGTGITIEPHDILIIHTGYHRHYPENWANRDDVDETKYFIRHPGPTREFAEWLLDRRVRWLAVDAGSADHPMNTVIRRLRADEAEDAESKLGRSLDELFPKADYQIMHTLLFPHDVIHIENLGGAIDDVLDQRIRLFPLALPGRRGRLLPRRCLPGLERVDDLLLGFFPSRADRHRRHTSASAGPRPRAAGSFSRGGRTPL